MNHGTSRFFKIPLHIYTRLYLICLFVDKVSHVKTEIKISDQDRETTADWNEEDAIAGTCLHEAV